MASQSVRITVLADNTASGRGLLAEHGLAFWIETGHTRVLFDTGQGNVLLHNASKLGVELELADAVVLSHGHYDHTGGLADVLRPACRAKVYTHPAALRPKYARDTDGAVRNIGVSPENERAARDVARELIWTKGPVEIARGLFATGEIPRVTDFEDTGGAFFLDEESQQPDPLIDDQAVFYESPSGSVVFLGCAHAGVINTLRHIRQLTSGRPIHTVVGGMHLVEAGPRRMDRTVAELRRLGVQRLAPAHCTGPAATALLWSEFPERCIPSHVGTAMEVC